MDVLEIFLETGSGMQCNAMLWSKNHQTTVRKTRNTKN